MNQLPAHKRAYILSLLVEGNSLRSISRITCVSINTVTKLLIEVGTACQAFHDRSVQNLWLSRLQLDELWAFIGAKTRAKSETFYGDVWTFVALCPDTKLMLSWKVGKRDDKTCMAFVQDIRDRTVSQLQITTDGYPGYEYALRHTPGIDYAQIVKKYGYAEFQFGRSGHCKEIEKLAVIGNPDEAHISTSHVERNNLTIRRGCARYARSTNAHSKKLENHRHAFALHSVHYNWCRVHQTTKITPAMAVGLTDKPWSLGDLLHL